MSARPSPKPKSSVGIGDVLPSVPLFLSASRYIPAPLEATYTQAWDVYPAQLKAIITT